MKGIQIKIVEDPEELKKIYELRFQVYKDVLNVDIPYMNYETQELKEDIDKKSLILAAYINDQLAGTIRGTIYKNLTMDDIPMVKHYNILTYQDASLDNSGEVAKFCVKKEYQHFGVSPQLLKASLELGITVNKDLKYIFLEALEMHVKYYQFFHFKILSEPLFHDIYQLRMVPMVLDIKESISQFHLNI